MTKINITEAKNIIRPTLGWQLKRLSIKLRILKDELKNYIIGEYFCRFFHKPLFWGCPTVTKNGSLYQWSCAYCNRKWESYRKPKSS